MTDRDCASGKTCMSGACAPSAATNPDAASMSLPPGADPGCAPPPAAEGCGTGLAKCGGAECLVSLSSNHDHCGRCGRSCRGGECQAGACQRIPLASDQQLTHRRLVAIGGDLLYWATSDGKLMSVPLAGATAPTTLATGEGAAQGIVLDADFAYVTAEGGPCQGWCVRRIPLVPQKFPTTTVADIGQLSGGIAIAGDVLYWFDSSGSIMRLPTRAPGLPAPQALAIDQGPATREIAVDDEYVYWASHKESDGIVKRMRRDGSSAVPEHVAAGLQEPTSVAVDQWNVYWTDLVAHTVQMAPKQGGPVVTLAADEVGPVEIGLDDVNVYWGGSGGVPGMRKVSRCGGAQPSDATGGASVAGIIVHDGSVFWNDNTAGLFRMAQ